MMIRVLIVSPQWRRLEALLMGDARFYVLDALPDGSFLAERCAALCPELLVWHGQPFPTDLGAVTASPPKVIELVENGQNAHPLADKWIGCREDGETMLNAMADAALPPLPNLARETLFMRLRFTEDALKTLGVPERLKGYRYILHGVAACASAPSLLACLRDRLYPMLGADFTASPAAVERDIRTAIEATWLRGDLEGIQRCFGATVDAERGKPTNAEFVSTLAQQVRQRVQRHLDENRVSG